MADTKLPSGPAGSEQYAHPWLFQDYVPDDMVYPLSSILSLTRNPRLKRYRS
jgi:hypothetical protein